MVKPLPTLLKTAEISQVFGRYLNRMFAGAVFGKGLHPGANSSLQEDLQRSEIAVFRCALDIRDGGSNIRALLPNLVSEFARLSRLTKRNK
jgi:hypothetical protein